MICPKCKKEIPDNSLKCEHCNARVGSICKTCHSYNHIYNVRCINCNTELIKFCPSCKSVNLPDAMKCRKCGYIFQLSEDEYTDIDGVEEDNSLEAANLTKSYSQQAAKELLQKAVYSQNKKIISLQGETGIGKSIVVKSVINEFTDGQITWLSGECSHITQLSPCGYIQNLLINCFNIPSFCVDATQLIKDSQEFFSNEFSNLSSDEVCDLLNLLYPQKMDFYEKIFINKEKTINMLLKVFRKIIETNRIVIIVENFDLIDGMSYEVLKRLLEMYSQDNRVKFLLTYKGKKPALGCFYSDMVSPNSYFDVLLMPLDKGQIAIFTDRSFEKEKCPQSVKNKLFLASKGNPAIMEQLVGLLHDYMKVENSFESELPSDMKTILEMRLEYLKANANAYKVLCLAAIQGLNFSPAIINDLFQGDEVVLVETLNYLQKLNYIMPVNQNTYAFKNTLLWSELFEIIKKREGYNELCSLTCELMSEYVLSSNSILAIMTQNLDLPEKSFEYWTKNIAISSYIGDLNLYIVSQKQCMDILKRIDIPNKELLILNISEKLGKLLTRINPSEAMSYLQAALENATTLKSIDLLTYMTECCKKTGNYSGVVECVDSIVSKIDISNELEIAMVKSRKLNALLNTGNCGELINIADNEVLPVLEKFLDVKNHKVISKKMLCKTWLKTYLVLANALIFQGNNRAFEVISILFELFDRNGIEDENLICKTKLALAMMNTLRGDIQASQEILNEIVQIDDVNLLNPEIISQWNMVKIFNKLIAKNYENLNEELFKVVMYANNIGDDFTKNILKTMLGKFLKENQKSKQALEIYSEQIAYFSKEKNAIGALLTWYLIAEVSLQTEGPDKALSVAQKALDVAKNPKINNYLFIVLYNKIIAEAEIIKGDYEGAKINIEKAVMFARKFEMQILLASLYLLYGKYLQDLALAKTDATENYAMNSFKMYKKAMTIAKELKNENLMKAVLNASSALESFCRLNQIKIK